MPMMLSSSIRVAGLRSWDNGAVFTVDAVFSVVVNDGICGVVTL